MLASNPTGTTIPGQQRYVIAYFVLVLASAGIAALLLLAFQGILPTLPIITRNQCSDHIHSRGPTSTAAAATPLQR